MRCAEAISGLHSAEKHLSCETSCTTIMLCDLACKGTIDHRQLSAADSSIREELPSYTILLRSRDPQGADVHYRSTCAYMSCMVPWF